MTGEYAGALAAAMLRISAGAMLVRQVRIEFEFALNFSPLALQDVPKGGAAEPPTKIRREGSQKPDGGQQVMPVRFVFSKRKEHRMYQEQPAPINPQPIETENTEQAPNIERHQGLTIVQLMELVDRAAMGGAL